MHFVTPVTTVTCKTEILLSISLLALNIFSSEQAGDMPHTIQFNIEILITAATSRLNFFHLNWRVIHLIQFGVT